MHLFRPKVPRPSAGAKPNLQDNRGMTALMIASSEGYGAAVQELLDRGADRSLKDREGKTARDHAAAAGHDDIVKILTATESRRSASADRR